MGLMSLMGPMRPISPIKMSTIFKHIFLPLACCILSLMSCKEDISSVYSSKNRVQCGFNVASYAELINCIDNLGQFSSIRQSGSKIIMSSSVSTNSYDFDAVSSRSFYFGLGGLIVGTPNLTSDGNPYRCYDLACPNCDRASYRLSISDNGRAKCSHCGIVYDLNNNGSIIDRGSSDFESPRVLYRYRITYDGMMIHMYN